MDHDVIDVHAHGQASADTFIKSHWSRLQRQKLTVQFSFVTMASIWMPPTAPGSPPVVPRTPEDPDSQVHLENASPLV